MDKIRKRIYSKTKVKRIWDEVNKVRSTTAAKNTTICKLGSRKKPSNFAELRNSIATHSAFGEKLVDLYKEGK